MLNTTSATCEFFFRVSVYKAHALEVNLSSLMIITIIITIITIVTIITMEH
jgi:hypothetical protein